VIVPTPLDRRLLAGRFARARPFPHVIVDDWLDLHARGELMEALADEPSERIVSEIYEVMATGEPTTPGMKALAASMSSEAMLETIGAIAGHRLGRLSLRGYAYGPGHYLLPHHDRDLDSTRCIAFVAYLEATDDLRGGELELFACRRDGGTISEAVSASIIEPRPGRLVLFDVSDDSLHRVREVTAGRRTSLAGWYYRQAESRSELAT
jgi:2OG-Fe(II) oxygenase superfamily